MPPSEKSKHRIHKMCAPILTIDVAAKRWTLIIALCIISSCCCFHGVDGASGVPTEVKYPCAFIDTINVTGTPWAYEQPNASNKPNVIHTNANNNNNTFLLNLNTNGTINNNKQSAYDNNNTIALLQRLNITFIPAELIAAYNFVIKDGVRVTVNRHLRACICKLKPCISFCCDAGYYYDTITKKCVSLTTVIDIDSVNGTKHNVAFELTGMDHHEVPVRRADGNTRLVQTVKHFNVRIGVPCERMRLVYRSSQLVHWSLFENGTIAHRNYIFPTYYCYTPHQVDNITWKWQPLACVPKKLPFVLGTKEWTYAICLILAVICMIIVLFIYLFSTEIRKTFFGVAIAVYSMCIIIGYSLMAHLTLTDPAQIARESCIHIAACVIFYLVLSYYILSFISFNFYIHFHGIILSRAMFWLILFPIVLVGVGWSIFSAKNNYEGKAVFGGDTCCPQLVNNDLFLCADFDRLCFEHIFLYFDVDPYERKASVQCAQTH
ncbi:probable G-protein coupled receptor Mth-like 8 isoform X2 [Eurosta solidaginis]|uniref:probable G-protein coupled receptor Mth-like 8 isoform X2 n=1 Tax=Eurosta solidaginis TaxID=178769 RepID=UPI0035317761